MSIAAGAARPITRYGQDLLDQACAPVTELTRPGPATVTGTDMSGRPVTVVGTGVLARRLRHETDRLDGSVYVGKLPAAERTAILAAAGLNGRQPRSVGIKQERA